MTEWLTQMLNDAVESGSVLIYFFVFAGGVLASFTPCTYPVLPLTVGYIGNMSGGSKFRGFLLSVTLVCGMALVYAVFGTIFATLGMQFGAIWANGWAVFAIAWFFILMSLFLLDIFTFPTPKFFYNLQAKVGGKKREGFVGALLVGAVSGLVVGPCTGPILAIVIVAASTTLQEAEGVAFAYQALAGGLKLFLFGFGQGAIILLAGTFVGFMTHMPKSGQWMVTIKKAFAVLIIAGASLLLVYVGQATDFPELTELISSDGTAVESSDEPLPQSPEPHYGGDEFLDG